MPLPRQPSTKRGRNASIASSLRLRLIARRSPSASPTLNPAAAIDTSSTWSWKTTTPSVSRERLAQRLVLDRHDVARVLAQAAAVLDVRVDGLALDRPRADERDLHGQVVEVLGLRAQQALHLRAALDLEDADGVGGLDLGVDGRVVERDAREVDRLAVQARDRVDRLLDGGEHAEPEQVDLEEARRRSTSPCPTGRAAGRPSRRA